MRLVLFTFLGFSAIVRAGDPPVTDATIPSPRDAVAKRWLTAAFESSFLELAPPNSVGSEAARMLATLRRNEPLRSGAGWYDPGTSRFGWRWFANRYDKDGNQRISRQEFDDSLFSALDRDRDGTVTVEDFDWSDRSAWAKQNGISLRLFRAIDRDGSGKISEQEMLDHFRRMSGEKGHLSPEDVRDMLLRASAAESGKGQTKGSRSLDEGWMKGLAAGDLGSPFDGPRVGQVAPDFTLSTQDGKSSITLSKIRDRRPVVLIFGSFT